MDKKAYFSLKPQNLLTIVLLFFSSRLMKKKCSDMKLGNYKLGLLMNFNVSLLKNGIKRVINGYF